MSKSIIQNDNTKCFVCGDQRNLEEHHIFQGINRQNSEHYGLKVMLCHKCHNEPPEGAHCNNDLRRELHLVGETAFVNRYDKEKFLEVFGKDYIEAGLSEGCLREEFGMIIGKYGVMKRWLRGKI